MISSAELRSEMRDDLRAAKNRIEELENALEPCVPIVQAWADHFKADRGLWEHNEMHIAIIEQARNALASKTS